MCLEDKMSFCTSYTSPVDPQPTVATIRDTKNKDAAGALQQEGAASGQQWDRLLRLRLRDCDCEQKSCTGDTEAALRALPR
jgi:hypothetical protein